MEYVTHSQQETTDLGKKIAPTLRRGDVLCLYGELGVGKTMLVKGIARGLGVKEEITSPTFTLMNVYMCHPEEALQRADEGSPRIKAGTTIQWDSSSSASGGLLGMTRLVHIDTYRLKNEQELVEIGVEDYLGREDTVCVVEWPEKIIDLLKGQTIINIYLKYEGGESRMIEII